jgi:uncharacterized protein (DUF885 family)
LPDDSAAAIEVRRGERAKWLERAKGVDASKLDEGDGISLRMLIEELEQAIASEVCRFEEWSVSPRSNPITRWNNLPEMHTVNGPRDLRTLLVRYRGIAKSIDDEVALLRVGADKGWFATRESIRRLLDMTDKQLGQPLDDWPMLAPASKSHPGVDAQAASAFATELRAIVDTQVRPALVRYAALLRDELSAKGRDDEHSGVGALPQGEACYRARIRSFTTLSLSSDEVHRLGLDEIARIDGEMATLGKRALKTRDLATTLTKLRSDPALRFSDEAEVEAAAVEALAAAKGAMGRYFGVLPKADCVVRRVPDYEAPYTTIAYYRPPHADGSKPGEYFVNVLHPETRPRYEARVLALHEAIPGHHLQIAIAQELAEVPAFRKHGGVTAYVEGWALYTERLGDEMGMYQSDLDRIGMLSFDAWRAGRLVVDTGIHAKGWSRAQAKRFLQEHTALSLENIDNEVDRYINWPGQALGYKLGQLEIVALRRKAEERLGEKFDLPTFHDVVLGAGAVSLPILRERIAKWIDARTK